jgi:hypothetical protein
MARLHGSFSATSAALASSPRSLLTRLSSLDLTIPAAAARRPCRLLPMPAAAIPPFPPRPDAAAVDPPRRASDSRRDFNAAAAAAADSYPPHAARRPIRTLSRSRFPARGRAKQ